MSVCKRCECTLDETATHCPRCGDAVAAAPPDDYVVVFTTQREIEATLVAQVLTEVGIPNLERSAGTQSFLPLVTGKLATVEILVLERDAEAARRAIAQLRTENGEAAHDV